jgi:integrase
MGNIHRLSDLKVRSAKTPGMYADGGGLYLQVRSAHAKSWIFRYESNGQQRYVGLGSLDTISLARAREKAREARELRLDGKDPIAEKRAQRAATEAQTAKAMTFAQGAEKYIASHAAGWRSAIHSRQWKQSLADHVLPIIGDQPVGAIDAALVLKVLEPIWTAKPETASRVRGRIEAVLDWAKARGYRAGENPAKWRGHLDQLLPSRSKVRAVAHHAALPYQEIGAFMAALRQRDSIAATSLELTILTAARSNEMIGARWDEIDGRVWTVPAARMKAGKEHRVPLSDVALAALDRLRAFRKDEHVIPRPFTKNYLLGVVRGMGRDDVSVHGFRSTFRDWAAEQTSFPNHVVEQALAHAIGDKVEAAYRRGDLFEKRARLMAAWAEFCARPAAKGAAIVPMRTA